jgi:hypothetical protein
LEFFQVYFSLELEQVPLLAFGKTVVPLQVEQVSEEYASS